MRHALGIGVLVALILMGLALSNAWAQGGGRYYEEVFQDVKTTQNVKYGEALDYSGNTVPLYMDVYEPQGDDASYRALIIFIHGGGFVGGDKASWQWRDLCTAFAKRGYVAASINYRLQPPWSEDFDTAIFQAMYDAKAAIRYFRKNALLWRIHSNKIAVAGGSAGAITALHATYLTEPQYEGNSGNPGYDSSVCACVDLWGGLYSRVDEIDPGEPPVLIIHGTEDLVVPYSEATKIVQRCEDVGVHYESHPLVGEGHAPWGRMEDFFPWMVDFLYQWDANNHTNRHLFQGGMDYGEHHLELSFDRPFGLNQPVDIYLSLSQPSLEGDPVVYYFECTSNRFRLPNGIYFNHARPVNHRVAYRENICLPETFWLYGPDSLHPLFNDGWIIPANFTMADGSPSCQALPDGNYTFTLEIYQAGTDQLLDSTSVTVHLDRGCN